MNNKNITVVFLVLLFVVLLAGCGPVYRTEYSYQPPQDPQGRNCLMQCENMRMQCRTNEDYRLRSCEDQNRIARLEYDNCMAMKYDRCRDNSTYCGSSDYERCDMDYRLCYQNCGGIISSREICVYGCEK